MLLSGGSGTRLWPISRSLYPKQLLPMAAERTMFQETASRFSGAPEFAPPVIVCNDEHRFIIASQIQAAGIAPHMIVLEPVGRNTAPAAAVAALLLAEQSPGTLMLLAPSDHVIDDVPAFLAAISLGARAAAQGRLVTFGIRPNRPETGYGYIKRGAELATAPGAFAVAGFVEKPNHATAEGFVAAGDYFWNSGMFLFSPELFLAELSRHAPDILVKAREALQQGRRELDFLRLDRDAFAAAQAISIDYAVMERTDKAAVVPADIGWSDVGSWSMLWERGTKDADGNVVAGDVLIEDGRNNLIRSEGRLVATVGVDNLIVVATKDAVLVTRRDRDQDVKRVVERLVKAGRPEASQHPRVHRPWGFFETLHLALGTQVKLIEVNPGAALSLQYHHKRAEHWVVVSGEAMIVRGDENLVLKENESTFIPIGMQHRLENRGDQPLQIIEVQVGSYLGEDDIVRLEDRYKRNS
ncbi:MAG TPA: mannose-1-phosphate guanylyltransferase/mannose-6-phosphate isomerase [Micropepsaceae bacterium]|nr:mannose-1-phosphate guanylyltransferase/mannose-6-phosphate isomerase [Micropepsaceae bacterium]